MAEEEGDWTAGAITAANLSETELLIGEIAAAEAWGEKSIELADRAGERFRMMVSRTTQADALHAAGEWEKAEALFADAERRQGERRPEFPLLYSVQGYRYCDLLLSRGGADAARERATRTLELVRPQNWVLDIALDALTLGRTNLVLSLVGPTSGRVSANVDARVAASGLNEAVEGLRASRRNDFLPRGLFARAAFRRAVGEWDGAARDLDEAEEIAEPGPMRLYLCDCALERARLALARRGAFAPLAGLVEPSPPPRALPDVAAAAVLREEARKELDAARRLIADCGYHRRDEELAELDDAATGRRRFADLPPRV
jgi:tetratricopeptide (TPR) repeat protein